MDPIKTVVQEALTAQRDLYVAWLNLKHASKAERELAELKISLIDIALKENAK